MLCLEYESYIGCLAMIRSPNFCSASSRAVSFRSFLDRRAGKQFLVMGLLIEARFKGNFFSKISVLKFMEYSRSKLF